MPKPKSIPIYKRIQTYIFLLPVLFVLGIGTGYLIWGRPVDTADTGSQGSRFTVSEDDNPAIGPEDAEITIIEFSDYQCGYCKRWHDQVFDRLMANYPGQIRFVYRDFPVLGEGSSAAAEAANCAGEQESYWLYHRALFRREYGLDAQAYLNYAAQIGLDMEEFSQCMETHRQLDEVTADYDYAVSLGLRATPTFFINGIPIEGALPYENFAQILDEELAGEAE